MILKKVMLSLVLVSTASLIACQHGRNAERDRTRDSNTKMSSTGDIADPYYSTHAASNGTDMEKREIASTMLHHVNLNFEPGSAAINPRDMEQLQTMVSSHSSGGGTSDQQLQVAVWSDKSLPMNGKELPRADRDLAKKRIRAVQSALDNQAATVKTYNMADRSNWLARMFSTKQAELQSAFAKNESADVRREDFNLIRQEGGPSKAVVIFGSGDPSSTRSTQR